MLAKATMNYLLKREHILERCLLKLGTLPLCLADLKVQLQIAKAETQRYTVVDGTESQAQVHAAVMERVDRALAGSAAS